MWHRLSPALRHRILFLVVGNLVLLAVIFGCLLARSEASFGEVLPRFWTVLSDAGPNVAPIVLAALGLTGIICCGAIDLSIGAVVVVAGTVLGILYTHGYGPSACFAACFLTALGLSAFNGAFIRMTGIPAIIVTLAGLTVYRGLALVLADVSIPHFSGSIGIPQAEYHSPGKLYSGWILLTAVAAAIAWEASGRTFRTWLAHGCSRDACRLHGLRPGGILQSAFVVGGMFLGLAALLYATNRQTLDPARMAQWFELAAIGAVVLGGTNIFGGEGSYIGSVLGAFFLYFADQTMIYADVGVYFREAIQGAVIIAVIGTDCALHRTQKRMDELR